MIKFENIEGQDMSNNIVPSFAQRELEISQAISTLKRHGIKIQLPESLNKQIIATTLFDGDDGLFKSLIRNSQVYFEYGCGKSTEYVYNFTSASIFSVDSSLNWVTKLKTLRKEEKCERLNLYWVDVGNVADWGRPTSFEKRQNFKKYAELLWLSKNSPDLVLIDGRFRVLCFLTTIKFAPVGTAILFDDYNNRPYYHVVEEFCQKLDTCGRQALFEVSANSKAKITNEIISSFNNVIE